MNLIIPVFLVVCVSALRMDFRDGVLDHRLYVVRVF